MASDPHLRRFLEERIRGDGGFMANEVSLSGVGVEGDVKLRLSSTVAVLSVATLGIYSVFWYYKVNREMRDYGSSHGDRGLVASKPWRSVLGITIGGVVVIPTLVSFVRAVRRVQAVERIAYGAARPGFGLTVALVGAVVLPLGASAHRIGVLLVLAGFVCFVAAVSIMQARLNAAWRASAAIAERSEHVPEAWAK
jgi:hypothetical protein